MGPDIGLRIANVMSALVRGDLAPIEIIARKRRAGSRDRHGALAPPGPNG